MSEPSSEGLTLVLPVWNQAAVLDRVVTTWSQNLQKWAMEYEIIVVDDGSSDATTEILEGSEQKPGLLQRIPHLTRIRHDSRKGYGACIRSALEVSRYPLFFYTGCDHQYQPADLKTMLKSIAETEPETGEQVALVNGYRATTTMPRWRKNVGLVYRIFLRVAMGAETEPLPGWLGRSEHRFARRMRLLFGVRLHDINSRFKLFRKSLLVRFPIQSDGDFVHGEIIAKANFLGCLMAELPIAAKPGPIPVSPEPPAPTDRGKELREVFRNPKFVAKQAEPMAP